MISRYKFLLALLLPAILAGCVTIPSSLQGNYAPLTPLAAQQGGAGGVQVRWGGIIIKTEPHQQETCFYLLARPLDAQTRPISHGNLGRFVACHSGFYDPEIFTRGRELTVTGTIHGIISQKVGDYVYAYPRVVTRTIYLWPKRPVYNYQYSYPPAFYNPLWGPLGWGYPTYPGPRVIILPRHVPPIRHH